MKITRNSLFETNSSSTHCLVYNESGDAGLLDTLQKDPTIWTIESYDGGWCETAKQKLDYIAGWILEYNPWYGKEPEPQERQKWWQSLCEVVKEQTGYNLYYPEWATFNESSQGTLDYRDLVENKENLRQFIFNPSWKMRIYDT